jgi:hypothetical protein
MSQEKQNTDLLTSAVLISSLEDPASIHFRKALLNCIQKELAEKEGGGRGHGQGERDLAGIIGGCLELSYEELLKENYPEAQERSILKSAGKSAGVDDQEIQKLEGIVGDITIEKEGAIQAQANRDALYRKYDEAYQEIRQAVQSAVEQSAEGNANGGKTLSLGKLDDYVHEDQRPTRAELHYVARLPNERKKILVEQIARRLSFFAIAEEYRRMHEALKEMMSASIDDARFAAAIQSRVNELEVQFEDLSRTAEVGGIVGSSVLRASNAGKVEVLKRGTAAAGRKDRLMSQEATRAAQRAAGSLPEKMDEEAQKAEKDAGGITPEEVRSNAKSGGGPGNGGGGSKGGGPGGLPGGFQLHVHEDKEGKKFYEVHGPNGFKAKSYDGKKWDVDGLANSGGF